LGALAPASPARAQPAPAAPPAGSTAPPAGSMAPPTGSTAPPEGPPPTERAGPAMPPLTAPPGPPPEPDADAGREAPEPLRYTLEAIQVRGNVRTRDRVVLRYVRFRPGQVFDVDDAELQLTRFRLLGTGFFRSVSLSLRRGTRRGAVVLVIDVDERNTVVVNDLWLGLSATATDAGGTRPLTAYGGADVAETNVAGTGITLGGAFALAADQGALRLRFFDPAFVGTPWMLQGTLYHNTAREFYGNRDVLYDDPVGGAERVQDYAVVRYRRFGGSLGAGHDLSTVTQLWLDYRLESIDASTPLAASHRRGGQVEPLAYGLLPGQSVASTLRATLQFDTRDAPVLPTRGWSIVAAGDLSLAPLGSSYPYQKLMVRASRWWPVGRRGHVARLDLFGGAIGGRAPVFEHFYAADLSDFLPDRILELNIDSRPPPNLLDTEIIERRYGEYALKVQGEYRVPLYRGRRSVYGLDLFVAGGLYALTSARDLDDPPRGYRGLRRLPVDATFNLGLRLDTSAGGFAFAFSNIFGFLPALGGQD
ncbi:MAG TPA: BamA/TamA family outer membrane protein, partial [Polyangiaceae bacterium]|nr:BamA/TamA family outer membrane protein [Polyangiaceae bacterium]